MPAVSQGSRSATLTFVLVVAPEGFIPGGPGVEEAQRVLGYVLFGEQLVVADDFGQRERLQHLLGEGLHRLDEHLIWTVDIGTGRLERGGWAWALHSACPPPDPLRGSGWSQGSRAQAAGRKEGLWEQQGGVADHHPGAPPRSR